MSPFKQDFDYRDDEFPCGCALLLVLVFFLVTAAASVELLRMAL